MILSARLLRAGEGTEIARAGVRTDESKRGKERKAAVSFIVGVDWKGCHEVSASRMIDRGY